MQPAQLILLLLAGLFVGLADILTKNFSQTGSFWTAIKSPWFFAVIILYTFQIIIFIYEFIKKSKLGIVGTLPNVFAITLVVLAGGLIFKEKLSLAQSFGVVLAIISLILMNL